MARQKLVINQTATSGMSEFENELTVSSASHSLDLDGENMMNRENMRELEETRYKSASKKSDSWSLGSSLTQRDLEVLKRGYWLANEVGARIAWASETARLVVKGLLVGWAEVSRQSNS